MITNETVDTIEAMIGAAETLCDSWEPFAEVDAAKIGEAKDLLDQAKQKLQEAREAIDDDDDATARARIKEALTLIQQALQKMREALP